MKKIILTIISVLMLFSCGVSTPPWAEYSSNGVYVECYYDTLTLDQLDSVLSHNDINPNKEEWNIIKYYNRDNEDDMMQFVYTKYGKRQDPDTTYIINNFDDMYILSIRTLNKYD